MGNAISRPGTDRVVAQSKFDQPINTRDDVVRGVLPIFWLPRNELRPAAMNSGPIIRACDCILDASSNASTTSGICIGSLACTNSSRS